MSCTLKVIGYDHDGMPVCQDFPLNATYSSVTDTLLISTDSEEVLQDWRNRKDAEEFIKKNCKPEGNTSSTGFDLSSEIKPRSR